MIILLSGVDGSGKSTIAEKIKENFLNNFKIIHIGRLTYNLFLPFLLIFYRILNKNLVLDRCIFDSAVYYNDFCGKIAMIYYRLMIAPFVDYHIFLDVCYNMTELRKGEINESQYNNRVERYKKMIEGTKIFILNNNGHIDDSVKKIFLFIKEKR